MAFSWSRASVSLAEALVGPGFGKNTAVDLEAKPDISTQAAKKVTQAIAEESLKKLKILLTSIDTADLVNVVDFKDPTTGITPLMQICRVKDSVVRQRMAEALLRHGADANLSDIEGKTALCHASALNLLDIIQVLMASSKTDPNIGDQNGNTPLIFAVKNDNDLAVRLLVRSYQRFGVLQVDAKNKAGESALSIAVTNRQKSIISVLINSGKAQVEDVLANGETIKTALENAGLTISRLKTGEWKLETDEELETADTLEALINDTDKNTSMKVSSSSRRSSYETSSQMSMYETGTSDI